MAPSLKDDGGEALPVKARAFVVEPAGMAVTWMNEAALRDLPASASAEGQLPEGGLPVETAIPLAPVLGLVDALRDVASTGQARHLCTSLVPMSRGSFLMSASLYALPDGKLLIVMEETWQASKGETGPGRAERKSRRPA